VFWGLPSIRRKRVCVSCDHRHSTMEVSLDSLHDFADRLHAIAREFVARVETSIAMRSPRRNGSVPVAEDTAPLTSPTKSTQYPDMPVKPHSPAGGRVPETIFGWNLEELNRITSERYAEIEDQAIKRLAERAKELGFEIPPPKIKK